MLKSAIYPVNQVDNLEELAGILSCKIGSLPTTYLGLPLGASFISSGIWNGVIKKMKRDLLHGKCSTSQWEVGSLSSTVY